MFTLLVTTCLLAAATPTPAAEVAALLSGHFSSAAQASADADFRDVRLAVAAVWTERTDGPWLYVEQAIAGSEAAPYRQRVYQLVTLEGGAVESRVYTLPEPARFVGAWRDPAAFATIGPADLSLRDGCAIRLARQADGTWSGRTGERSCPSELRGAQWATSEVVLDERRMVSWDRGFAADGSQVWGATKGGYEFVRQQAPPPAPAPVPTSDPGGGAS
jgi:CpeT protein